MQGGEPGILEKFGVDLIDFMDKTLEARNESESNVIQLCRDLATISKSKLGPYSNPKPLEQG